ncbi:MAG: hypothetical protein ACFFD3_17185, partial [Candidatus Thorarchaeota archaeon]
VAIYVGDNCAFCDTALETLREALADFLIDSSVISKVNVSSRVTYPFEVPGGLALPTIRVCDNLISGLPDIDKARSYLMLAILRGCFPI